jgi:2-iminoacetate synthase
MKMVKSGRIADFCQANAILTLQEYIEDYGDPELKRLGEEVIQNEIRAMSQKNMTEKTLEMLSRIKLGGRDFRF